MKGLVGRLIIIFCMILTVSGIFLLLNRPTGVAVDCEGSINGFGSPSYPLTSFDSGCSAEVEVFRGGESVCTGRGQVVGDASAIACEGLDDYSGEELFVEAGFYDEGGLYTNSSGTFFNGN